MDANSLTLSRGQVPRRSVVSNAKDFDVDFFQLAALPPWDLRGSNPFI
jgi:hypothetical protein